MRKVNIHEAKTNLSKLVAAAAAGEAFIIARAGKPLVKVVPVNDDGAPKPKRRIGFLDGKYEVPEDIKAFARDEIDDMFFGNPDKFQ